MHIDFALPPPDGNILKAWDNYQAKTRVAAMDFGLHIAITKLTDEVRILQDCCCADYALHWGKGGGGLLKATYWASVYSHGSNDKSLSHLA